MRRSSPSNPKTERLGVRVSSEDKRMIERAAALSGQSVASFVIDHAREAADKVLKSQSCIQLNARNSKRFAEGLLAPPREAPAFVSRAFESYRRQVREG